MILADKIIDLRKKCGWSQEELAEKLDVSRQSISKWESAQSVPDMKRIVQLSEIFGVSTDYLLKDEIETDEVREIPEDYPDSRKVTMEEANAFMEYKFLSAGRIAIGVMMCILSPVLMILLTGAAENGVIGISEDRAAGFSMLVMFLLIGGAVALFVTTGLKGNRFDYMETELVETLYGVDSIVRDRREKFRPTHSLQLTIGIVLCVISVIPIFIGLLVFGEENEFALEACTGVLLVLVAIGVFLIVRVSIVWGGFQMLLQEGDYSREKKISNKRNEPLSTIYWCAAIAIYLAWSFITMEWHRTWIVWPIAGVAYGLVTAIAGAVRK